MPFFNLQDVPNFSEQDTGCPPGYSRVGDVCVNSLTEDIFKLIYSSGYEFEYYENAGELVGRYKLFDNDADIASEVFLNQNLSRVRAAGSYFNQNVNITKVDSFGMANPAQNLTPQESILFVEVKHVYNGPGDEEVEILHPFLNDAFIEANPDFLNVFYFGEFHFITNTLKSVKRVNLAYDVLQDLVESEDWEYHKAGFTPFPKPVANQALNSFIDWYFGYARLPERDRPTLNLDRVDYPSIKTPINGTDWVKWKTLSSVCGNYRQVFNGTELGDYFTDLDRDDGNFLCQFKATINLDRLKTAFTTRFDGNTYPVSSETNKKEMTYQIIIYPPSMYLYPVKNPVEIVKPRLNSINDPIEEIVFKAPQNYKSDGNLHFGIKLFESKASDVIIHESSSYFGSENFEEFLWLYTNDTDVDGDYVDIPTAKPGFTNLYTNDGGVDSESATYIKYTLSEKAKLAIAGKTDIIFKITQLDGTLLEPY